MKCHGAGGGTWTRTGIRPPDFKSGMSTIPSRPQQAAPALVLNEKRETSTCLSVGIMFIGYKNFCAKFIGIPHRFRSQLKSADTSSFTACIAT